METVRRDLLRVLIEISAVAPQIRMGQMISNFAFIAAPDESIYDVEDHKLLEIAKDYLKAKTGSREPKS